MMNMGCPGSLGGSMDGTMAIPIFRVTGWLTAAFRAYRTENQEDRRGTFNGDLVAWRLALVVVGVLLRRPFVLRGRSAALRHVLPCRLGGLPALDPSRYEAI